MEPFGSSERNEVECDAEKRYQLLDGQPNGADVVSPARKVESHRSSSDSAKWRHGAQSKVEAEKENIENEYEVNWDGDHDPMNPRSMSKPRKWLIVIIVSMSSLCV